MTALAIIWSGLLLVWTGDQIRDELKRIVYELQVSNYNKQKKQ